jgi:hypothetical protein
LYNGAISVSDIAGKGKREAFMRCSTLVLSCKLSAHRYRCRTGGRQLNDDVVAMHGVFLLSHTEAYTSAEPVSKDNLR